MTNRIEELYKLKEQMNLTVTGLSNIPSTGVSLVVANHTRLTDIYFLTAALPILNLPVISSRSIFKKDIDKQEKLNQFLYPVPIEVRDRIYSKMGISWAINLLCNGLSINIYPEGAYLPNKMAVYKGRTGMSRILFGARDRDVKVNLIAAAIKSESNNNNLNGYEIGDEKVQINFLPTIDYEKEYDNYRKCRTDKKRNIYYHLVVDRVMQEISRSLDIPYLDEYLELALKESIYFPSGEKVLCSMLGNSEYIKRYRYETAEYFINLQKEISKAKIKMKI